MSGDEKIPGKLNLVLYWHMHQPDYRDLRNGEYRLPWTYLHCTKDYVDMVAHIENNQKAKAVVNFAPVLLEQIDDYEKQLHGFINHGSEIRDPLLSLLVTNDFPDDEENRRFILESCLRANKARLIDRFDVFKKLAKIAQKLLKGTENINHYSDQFFIDVLVWYHLAWMAETARLGDVRIIMLMEKASNYSEEDRSQLLVIIYELIKSIIPRYRKLAEKKQIELSMTPYAHPIIPLLLDINSAREAMPDAELPNETGYPGGEERSRWQMKKGIDVFQHYFGFPPNGCWPSEGSISAETIELMSDMGLNWLASGETVLHNSLEKSGLDKSGCEHAVYQYRDNSAACFFRDDGLSDLIGFKYSDWHGDDAVANLVHHLQEIAKECGDKPGSIVSIILDGENAWEYYPENGYHFISALYEKLSDSDEFNLTTYNEYLSENKKRIKLNEIVAGSWVYGTFSTWIGEKDKNRAWDILIEAKKVYDEVMSNGSLNNTEIINAEMQLATCESSDWFWWFGESNSADSVAAFDQQFRLHISNLYKLLNKEPPEYLQHAFSFGNGESVSGGAMLPGKEHQG